MAPTRRELLNQLAGFSLASGALPGMSATPVAAAQEESELARQQALRELLAKNNGLRPEFGPGYSNHVSMGLLALLALGGSAAQLRAFADASWRPLEPLPQAAGPEVRPDNFESLLGQRSALNGYRRLFAREVSQLGRAATLEKYLPELLPALSAGLFHPLIRTGYGVRFGDDSEVVVGLAYWATAYLPLGPLPATGTKPEPRPLLQLLHEARRSKGSGAAGTRSPENMRNAARVPEFAATVAALQPDEDTLRKLAGAALELYTVTGGNFTALHAVTGTHGLRMLWPHVSQKELALRYLWQALVAAYLTVGAPALSSPPAAAPALPDWQEIVAKVVSSTDAHDLKLVDVAREESVFYREPGYRRAAALRLHLV